MDSSADRDEIRALEERVAALERTVSALTGAKVAPPVPPAQPSASPRGAPVLTVPQPPAASAAAPKPVRPARWVPEPLAPRLGPTREPAFDLEQWLGARGLLLVGVVALLAAAGFFLKYAFDRGWVAPGVRVLGAVVLGLAVAVFGERQVVAGMRRFGLALVGAGGGLVFLGIWAAAGPYVLISRPVGIVAITVTAIAVAVRAVHHDAEPLVLWALLGAFMAPLVLRTPVPREQVFLSYVGVVGFAMAAVAKETRWRVAMAAGLMGSLLLGLVLVPHVLHSPLGFLYLTASGVAALYLPPTEWWELRAFFVTVVWIAFVGHAGRNPGVDPYAVSASVVLLLAGWWQHRGSEVLRARRIFASSPAAELAGFLVAPIACAIVVTQAGGAYVTRHPELALGAVSALYLATGWRGRWAAFVGFGWALAVAALSMVFADAAAVGALSAAIVAGAAADRWQDQEAMMPVTFAVIVLVGLAVVAGLLVRPRAGEVAFARDWALAMYAYLGAVVLAATWWMAGPSRPPWAPKLRGAAWAAAGTVLFLGVSIELPRVFSSGGEGSALAGNLATSVWWVVYAGLLVGLGFGRSLPGVRRAGLAVACLAAAKVLLVDLSVLEALYRVAAFFVLALIALAVAYAYNRRAGGRTEAPPTAG